MSDGYWEQVVGYAPDGTLRVFAPTLYEAHIEAHNYVKRRPDMGPLDKWTFKLLHYRDDIVVKRTVL